MMGADHGSPTRFLASDAVYTVSRLKPLKSHEGGYLWNEGVTPYEPIRNKEKIKTDFPKLKSEMSSRNKNKPKENL